MQFKSLVKNDPHHAVFFDKMKGTRFMKYDTTEVDNPVLARKFPLMQYMFDENTKLCGNVLHRVSVIKCEYVSAAPNVLVNYRGVTEQRVHCDYNPETN